MEPRFKKEMQRSNEPQQGVARCCGECEEGLCCGGKIPEVIPLEALLEGLQTNSHPCKGSACDPCGGCEP